MKLFLLFCVGQFLLFTSSKVSAQFTIDPSEHENWKNLPKQCGRSVYDVLETDYIIGGQVAKMGQFPWMAILGYDMVDGEPDFSLVQCAGTIIHSRYVVTAVHCVVKIQPVVIRFGDHDITQDVDCNEEENLCNEPVDHWISSIVMHENYDTRSKQNDIALLKLKTPIIFTDFVQPICLPNAALIRKDLDGMVAIVAGWGLTQTKPQKPSPILRFVEQEIWNLAQCRNKYISRELTRNIIITSKQICAGGVDGKDSCNGDSGGPLMFRTSGLKRKHYIIGIVSYGSSECASGLAGIYANTRFFVDWILDRMIERS